MLTEKEKHFLILCIIMSAREGFYKGSLDSNEEIIELLKKLGADEIDIEYYKYYYN